MHGKNLTESVFQGELIIMFFLFNNTYICKQEKQNKIKQNIKTVRAVYNVDELTLGLFYVSELLNDRIPIWL